MNEYIIIIICKFNKVIISIQCLMKQMKKPFM